MPTATENNWKELIVRYKNLPVDARSLFFNEDVEQMLAKITEESNLPPAKAGVIADHISYLLLGILKPMEFSPSLARELGVDALKVAMISRTVSERILSHAKEALQEQYGANYESELLSGTSSKEAVPIQPPARPQVIKPAEAPPAPPPPLKQNVEPPRASTSSVPSPQPIARQAPPPPSITMLEPHPIAPPFPKAPPPPAPPPPAPIPSPAAGAAPAPAPQFRPVVIPESLARPAPPMPPHPAEPKVQAADTASIIQKHYGDLSPAVRDAIKNIPIDQILYAIGEEQQLTVEQMGKMADGVMRFIAGKASQEEFLDLLLEDIFGGFRQKSAIVSQEINAKVFTPIRKALRVATAEPTPHAAEPATTLPKPSVPPPTPAPVPKTAPPPPLAALAQTAPVKPPLAAKPAMSPAPKAPSEPEPWIIYPLRQLRPHIQGADKGLAGLTSPVPMERPDRPGWGDAYPPLDREVIPPIRPEGAAAGTESGARGTEPPPNLPTGPSSGADVSQQPATPLPAARAVPLPAPAQAAAAQTPKPAPPPPPAPTPQAPTLPSAPAPPAPAIKSERPAAPPPTPPVKTAPPPPPLSPTRDQYREAVDE